MSTIDRAALEEAIRVRREQLAWWKDSDLGRPSMELVLAAASAHLESLPKTKMVEVWRVEMAEKKPDGSWKAIAYTFESEGDAARDADFMRREPGFSCVKLTGPHLQEVPA